MPFATARARSALATLLVAAPLGLHAPARANPTVGFVEHWPGSAGTATWGGGDTYSNPGTGGQGGAGDGFLLIQTPGPTPFFSVRLGAKSSDAAYSGDWQAAGIAKVEFWLKDVGNPNPLEMHLGIGNSNNFWQNNTGLIPPSGTWAKFDVDVTDSSNWTQTVALSPGTYTLALQTVTQVLIRHDHAPYVQDPDSIRADVGLDEFAFLGNGNTAVAPPGAAVARPVELAPPYPNPASGEVRLALHSYDAAPIRIEIVDATGRVIRRSRLAVGAGSHLWTWDGRTDAGAAAPPGYYRARAYSTSGGTSQPLVRLGRAQ